MESLPGPAGRPCLSRAGHTDSQTRSHQLEPVRHPGMDRRRPSEEAALGRAGRPLALDLQAPKGRAAEPSARAPGRAAGSGRWTGHHRCRGFLTWARWARTWKLVKALTWAARANFRGKPTHPTVTEHLLCARRHPRSSVQQLPKQSPAPVNLAVQGRRHKTPSA